MSWYRLEYTVLSGSSSDVNKDLRLKAKDLDPKAKDKDKAKN